MNDMWTLLPFALIFVLFYFFIMRPQRKAQQSRAAMLQGLKTGDKIVTVSHLMGEVVSVQGDILTIQIGVGDSVKVKIKRDGIASLAVNPVSEIIHK